jgi:hypothetical protein
MSFELREKLARVAGQVRSLRLWIGLALCWLVWAGVGAAMFAIGQNSGRPPLGWLDVLAFALVSAAICAVVALTSARDERAIAKRIEATHPELGTLLLAAVEQASMPRKELTYLQKAVICEAVAHGRLHNWNNAVGPWRLRLAKGTQFLTLALFAIVCVGLATRAGANSGFGTSLFGSRPATEVTYEVAVDPGNCDVERGSPLLVIAEFKGTMPSDATLFIAGGSDGSQSLVMSRSLDDPKFVGRVAEVHEDISYRVEYAGQVSDTFRAKVFDYPALVRADARLEFPEYTAQEPKVVEDVRHISAAEGTKLTLELRLNKPVADAHLVRPDGQKTVLDRDAKDNKLYRTSGTLKASRRYKLQLRDADGRASKMPEEFVISVTPNQPPKIALQRPARDVDVSPLEELQLKWKASDDYGIVRSGVSYSLGGNEPRDIVLPLPPREGRGEDVLNSKEQLLAHLIELESLEAKPDDLLSYFVWAEDIGPDGQSRRTSSDMYFAEVRPFEQIFRQGEQPSESEQRQQQQQQQGAGGNQQQAEELVQMQKEIINATWKLVRREAGAKPTAEFGKDTGLVKESQRSTIARATQMAESLEDPQSRGHLQSAQSHMSQALNQLTTAEQEAEPSALRPALSPEQAAYQDLLKLRAREFQVVRSNRRQQQQRGQSANRSNRMQRQLNQLELSADENRYETQNRARAPEENQAQQQSRETLNKLRELARRQEDMSDRLRELQSELEKAQSPREREELQRELKRLRDQQQEILRDMDEMIAQNDQSNNRQQSPDARQKMEDARSRVEQTSQALEQNQLSQAVTESARAGQQLKELRDDLRKQSANQFADDMTEMRRQARDIDAHQQQLSQQLEQQEQAGGRSLRPIGEAAETQEGLKEQRENLGNLLERMRQTIEAAEEPEPLLARQLYDAAREANQKRLEDRLDVARKLMDAGVRREAGEALKSADEGVNNLRRGVERAAESILGDEAESLRRAQSEIDELAEELTREINERRGASSQQSGAERDGAQQSNQGQQGEQRQQSNARDGASARSRGNHESNRSDQTQENDSAQDGSNQNQRNNSPREDSEQRRGNQPGSESDNQTREPNQRSGQQQSGAGQRSPERQQPPETNENDANNGNERQDRNDSDQRERSSLRGNSDSNANNDRPNQGGNDLQQLLERAANRDGARENAGGGPGNPSGPITGRDFRGWSQRLRDVEDMLDDADLRSEAARIRDRATEARSEYKKRSAEPDWEKLKVSIAEPLNELSRRLENEIRRHESPDALVPIDRDPVPPEFSEQVRRYYERLGSGE